MTARRPVLLRDPTVLPPAVGGRPAAVLVLFGVLDSLPAVSARTAVPRDLDVLLQRRATTLGDHPGQVSFPGGRMEPTDDGPAAAALREAVEETGLDPAGVEVLGELPAVPLAVSSHLVTPVPAWWARPSQVVAVDHAETVDVFRVPVADLVDPANRRTAVVPAGARGTPVTTPAFTVSGVLVWGFTALVLDRILAELGWAEPWDPTRTVVPYDIAPPTRPRR